MRAGRVEDIISSSLPDAVCTSPNIGNRTFQSARPVTTGANLLYKEALGNSLQASLLDASTSQFGPLGTDRAVPRTAVAGNDCSATLGRPIQPESQLNGKSGGARSCCVVEEADGVCHVTSITGQVLEEHRLKNMVSAASPSVEHNGLSSMWTMSGMPLLNISAGLFSPRRQGTSVQPPDSNPGMRTLENKQTEIAAQTRPDAACSGKGPNSGSGRGWEPNAKWASAPQPGTLNGLLHLPAGMQILEETWRVASLEGGTSQLAPARCSAASPRITAEATCQTPRRSPWLGPLRYLRHKLSPASRRLARMKRQKAKLEAKYPLGVHPSTQTLKYLERATGDRVMKVRRVLPLAGFYRTAASPHPRGSQRQYNRVPHSGLREHCAGAPSRPVAGEGKGRRHAPQTQGGRRVPWPTKPRSHSGQQSHSLSRLFGVVFKGLKQRLPLVLSPKLQRPGAPAIPTPDPDTTSNPEHRERLVPQAPGASRSGTEVPEGPARESRGTQVPQGPKPWHPGLEVPQGLRSGYPGTELPHVLRVRELQGNAPQGLRLLQGSTDLSQIPRDLQGHVPQGLRLLQSPPSPRSRLRKGPQKLIRSGPSVKVLMGPRQVQRDSPIPTELRSGHWDKSGVMPQGIGQQQAPSRVSKGLQPRPLISKVGSRSGPGYRNDPVSQGTRTQRAGGKVPRGLPAREPARQLRPRAPRVTVPWGSGPGGSGPSGGLSQGSAAAVNLLKQGHAASAVPWGPISSGALQPPQLVCPTLQHSTAYQHGSTPLAQASPLHKRKPGHLAHPLKKQRRPLCSAGQTLPGPPSARPARETRRDESTHAVLAGPVSGKRAPQHAACADTSRLRGSASTPESKDDDLNRHGPERLKHGTSVAGALRSGSPSCRAPCTRSVLEAHHLGRPPALVIARMPSQTCDPQALATHKLKEEVTAEILGKVSRLRSTTQVKLVASLMLQAIGKPPAAPRAPRLGVPPEVELRLVPVRPRGRLKGFPKAGIIKIGDWGRASQNAAHPQGPQGLHSSSQSHAVSKVTFDGGLAPAPVSAPSSAATAKQQGSAGGVATSPCMHESGDISHLTTRSQEAAVGCQLEDCTPALMQVLQVLRPAQGSSPARSKRKNLFRHLFDSGLLGPESGQAGVKL
eukprot:jgi/Botrbrau1/22631/Bobra.176_1s0058.1